MAYVEWALTRLSALDEFHLITQKATESRGRKEELWLRTVFLGLEGRFLSHSNFVS